MSFESGLRVYFQIDDVWTEATGDGGVYQRDGLSITRGYSDESKNLRPGSCSFTLKNHDLRYSPDNPMSLYYGKFGHGTPVAATVDELTFGLQVAPIAANGSTAPDSVPLSITGDIDLRAGTVGYEGTEHLVYKGSSYFLRLNPGPGSAGIQLRIQWYDAGAVLHTLSSDVLVPNGTGAFRATLDVDNGAGGHTATFYTATAWGDPWVQLGTPQVGAGTTAIQNTAATAVCGYSAAGGHITVTHAEIRSGIGGTVVASPDFTAETEGDTSFVDAQSNTWSVASTAYIGWSLGRARFVGEVAPDGVHQKQDTSGNDRFAEITASGVLARLGQGKSEIQTTLRSWVPTRQSFAFKAAAYWPLEEGTTASNGKPDVGGDVLWFQRPPNPIARFGTGNLRLPWVKDCARLLTGDRLVSSIDMDTDNTAWEIDFLYACGDGADMTVHLYTEVTVNSRLVIQEWQLQFAPSVGEIRVQGPDGSLSTSTVATAWDFDPFDGVGKMVTARWYPYAPTPTTAVMYIVISTNYPGEGVFGTNEIIDDGFSTTRALTPVGRLVRIDFEHVGEADKEFSLAHVAAFSCEALTSIYTMEVPAAGHLGEAAATRMARLCGENDVPITFTAIDTSSLMGPQKPIALTSALEECVDADQGLLVESRSSLGLHYTNLVQLYNKPAIVELDLSAGHLSPPGGFAPLRDVRNDVTVRRQDGAEARYEQTVGRLAVAQVGRYDTSVTVNVATDSQVGDHAAWLVHLGTAEDPRVSVTVDLARADLADLVGVGTLRPLDVGDRIDVVGLESTGLYDTVKLLVLGYRERLNRNEHVITFVCAPARPYETLVLDAVGSLAKLDSLGTTLNEDLDTTETGVTVAISDAGLWSTSGAQVPFDIMTGGERMTVTAVSGASSPQTFTVTRSVNGVVKPHSTGASVRLERPATLAYVRGT